uniref:Uncharacterized protein n=1 Tax=Geospiza parvula TaxID=87175 RepID=A0A8U8BZ14_GEOPR
MVAESDKTTPERAVLQAEPPQLPQPPLVLQPLPQPRCPSLASLQRQSSPPRGPHPGGAVTAPRARRGCAPGGPCPPPSPTLDHVAVDGGAELLAGRAVPVLPVDDPHLLEEGGLAALARAQQQDLDEALHVGNGGSGGRRVGDSDPGNH